MRATLADASLARYAGRFVWLKLDFDKTENGDFVERRGVTDTPTFYVLDPADERATAIQRGAMTLPELADFLQRGEGGMHGRATAPAQSALSRGDDLFARDRAAEAATAYREALRLAGPSGPEHERAVESLVLALSSGRRWQPCAEAAAKEAPRMARREAFGRVVLEGLACADNAPSAPWAQGVRKELEPLAEEAIALPETVRDHRFKLYQELMGEAQARGDQRAVDSWGEKWFAELDHTQPLNNDERAALDIARVDAAKLMQNPSRVLPALIASERAMPKDFNASLRLAQMEVDAKRYADAVAACNRGLLHARGPLGRAWLGQVKADSLIRLGRRTEARSALEEARRAAMQIGPSSTRERNLKRIASAMKETSNH